MNNNNNTAATEKAFNTYFRVEYYTINPVTGEQGWDIEVAFVKANTQDEAREKLLQLPNFDCVITIGRYKEMNRDCDFMLSNENNELVCYNIVTNVNEVQVGDMLVLKSDLQDGTLYPHCNGYTYHKEMAHMVNSGYKVKIVHDTENACWIAGRWIHFGFISHIVRKAPAAVSQVAAAAAIEQPVVEVAPAPVETKLERTVGDVRVGDKVFLKEGLIGGNDYGTNITFIDYMYSDSNGKAVIEMDMNTVYVGGYFIPFAYISHVERHEPQTSSEILEFIQSAIAGHEEQTDLSLNQQKTIALAQAISYDCFYFNDVCYAGTFDNALQSYMIELQTSRDWELSFGDFVLQSLEVFYEYDESDYSRDYTVYTDYEADEACAEAIKETVWAFNSSFLADETGIAQEVFAAIQSNGKCESNNDAILSCISDIDSFVIAAISADGRGHFLSQYDGEENEQTVFGNTFYLYRNN